jgi:hypothetical protein
MSLNRFVATINPTFTEASCKQHDNNLWFDDHTKQQAIAICQQCPEQELCRQYALTLPVDTDGIYAGLTAAELKPLRKQNGNPPVIDHGTKNGYQQHSRSGIPACPACLKANSEYTSRRKVVYKQRRKNTVPSNFEHGTPSGYTKHYLHGIPVCEDCKKAKAVYMRQRYQPK